MSHCRLANPLNVLMSHWTITFGATSPSHLKALKPIPVTYAQMHMVQWDMNKIKHLSDFRSFFT